MALSQAERALLRVTKATAQQLRNYDEASHLTTATGLSLAQLRDRACADRLALSEHFTIAGDKLLRSRPSQTRSAISRYYYGMYHAMRAVVYFVERGDDHERHSVLPGKTPADFPGSALWQNNLKDARERRNEADYNPYPASLTEYRAIARGLQNQAHLLLPTARAYLKSKGCSYL